jgi:L-lactate dehydrogenase complex protein LldG
LKAAFDEYYHRLLEAFQNESIALAIERATASYRKNVTNALTKYPHTVKLAKEVRSIKERSVDRWEDLLKEAMDNIISNNGQAYFAKTAGDAKKIISDLVGREKVVVKSKSLTSEEIGLRQHLESLGNEVWETDLGEFIIQLLGEEPMHILSPAIHVPREEVAKLFSNVMKESIPADIQKEVGAARRFLRNKYISADVGISGANIVSADTGAVFVLENEGNARLVTGLPEKHIVLVGIEKLVPTLADAFKVAEVTWRYAQYVIPSYMSLIGGPSKTGDIEKVITYGAHGPKEYHVVFIDNGRSELAKDPDLKEALYCLRCGGCMYECPVFSLVGGRFGHKYFIGYGAAWELAVSGLEWAAPIAYTCLRCDRCKERCPVEINTAKIVLRIRRLFVDKYRSSK